MVGLRLAAQAGSVEDDRGARLGNPRVEVPAVRREQPGPSHELSGAVRGDDHRAAAGDVELEGDGPVAQQVEGVRFPPLLEEHLAGGKRGDLTAAGDPLQLLIAQTLEDARFGEQPGDVALAHPWDSRPCPGPGPSPTTPSVARIAAASSVMSIATGHQVMQRPQPTQPEVPNWSIHVESLWVIHWR